MLEMAERPRGGRGAQAAGEGDENREGRALRTLVATALGVDEGDLLAEGRGMADIAFARQMTMYLAHTRLRMSLTAAGRLVGRDRTTARHACQQVEDRRDDPREEELLGCLESSLDLAIEIARWRSARRGHA